MLTSVTGNSSSRSGFVTTVQSRAFTLIELLVVLVIIAVISAVALLSIGIIGDDRNLQTQARRLSSLIELANDEMYDTIRDAIVEADVRLHRMAPRRGGLTDIFRDKTDD